MIDCVLKTGNLTSCNARLKQLGIVVRETGDETNPWNGRTEDRYEIVNTPILTDVSDDMYFCIRMTDEQAAKIPKNDTPNFATIWRSDEFDEEGNLLPWPEVEVQAYDIDGNLSGTRFQGAGRIV